MVSVMIVLVSVVIVLVSVVIVLVSVVIVSVMIVLVSVVSLVIVLVSAAVCWCSGSQTQIIPPCRNPPPTHPQWKHFPPWRGESVSILNPAPPT